MVEKLSKNSRRMRNDSTCIDYVDSYVDGDYH